MENRKVELIALGQILAEEKIHSGMILSESVLLLLNVITMMPLNYVLRKCKRGYTFSKSQKKINHPLNMEDKRVFAKNEKEQENL